MIMRIPAWVQLGFISEWPDEEDPSPDDMAMGAETYMLAVLLVMHKELYSHSCLIPTQSRSREDFSCGRKYPLCKLRKVTSDFSDPFHLPIHTSSFLLPLVVTGGI